MTPLQKLFLERATLKAYPVPTIAILCNKINYPVDYTDYYPEFAARFAAIARLSTTPVVQNESSHQESVLRQIIQWGENQILLLGIPSPINTLSVERCIQTSAWDKQIQLQMQQHLSHYLLSYNGNSTDCIEQYLWLYAMAAALEVFEPVAIVNEPAWTAHPIEWLYRILDPQLTEMCYHSPPLHLWTSFLAVNDGDKLYYFTKGFHLFGLPDLIFLAQPSVSPRIVQELFFDLFHYQYFENSDVQVGDIIRFDGIGDFQLNLPPEQPKMLLGPAGSYLVKVI
jgi:hypothetical protein